MNILLNSVILFGYLSLNGIFTLGNRCNLPRDSGRCIAYTPLFYYNSTLNKCMKFVYGGCGGNQNRFDTKAKCEFLCVKLEACLDTQPSFNLTQTHSNTSIKYYYDQIKGNCLAYIDDGLQTTTNRFSTLDDCQLNCVGSLSVDDYNSNYCYYNNNSYSFGQVFFVNGSTKCICHYGLIICQP